MEQPSLVKEMEIVKHHLVSCFNPTDFISSGKYAVLVAKKINEIKKKDKTPILCGGSGLYYRTIQEESLKEVYQILISEKN